MAEPEDELAARRTRRLPTAASDDFSMEVGWREEPDGSRVVALIDHELQTITLMNQEQARAVAKLLYDAADACDAQA